jgi:hypothetical protein
MSRPCSATWARGWPRLGPNIDTKAPPQKRRLCAHVGGHEFDVLAGVALPEPPASERVFRIVEEQRSSRGSENRRPPAGNVAFRRPGGGGPPANTTIVSNRPSIAARPPARPFLLIVTPERERFDWHREAALRRGRTGRDSSLCPTQRRNRVRTSPASRRRRKPPLGRGVGSATRRLGRPLWLSG